MQVVERIGSICQKSHDLGLRETRASFASCRETLPVDLEIDPDKIPLLLEFGRVRSEIAEYVMLEGFNPCLIIRGIGDIKALFVEIHPFGICLARVHDELADEINER